MSSSVKSVSLIFNERFPQESVAQALSNVGFSRAIALQKTIVDLFQSERLSQATLFFEDHLICVSSPPRKFYMTSIEINKLCWGKERNRETALSERIYDALERIGLYVSSSLLIQIFNTLYPLYHAEGIVCYKENVVHITLDNGDLYQFPETVPDAKAILPAHKGPVFGFNCAPQEAEPTMRYLLNLLHLPVASKNLLERILTIFKAFALTKGCISRDGGIIRIEFHRFVFYDFSIADPPPAQP